MLLTISTTHAPATDLGYLLYKHPDKVQTFTLNFGRAHVFYPEAAAECCTAALLLDISPVSLVRTGGRGFALDQYVNDRPYVASSFLSVAIGQVFRTALSGVCKEKQALADTPIALTLTVSALPCHGGENLLRRLFEPLGYAVTLERQPLDAAFPAWGASLYYNLTLTHIVRVQDALAHLYVLIPVLDNDKHYYVSDDEVEKLLRHGAGWLANHPERDLIAARYLKHQSSLKRAALARLNAEESPQIETLARQQDAEEAAMEEPLSLHQQRLGAVLAVLKKSGARRVLDLGCGEGRLLKLLLEERQFSEIVGMDVSVDALEEAAERLRLDRMPPRQRERITLLHGSLMYRDRRLEGYDAAAVVEVIEHLDPPRLRAFEQVVFSYARPGTVVITTPNAEYNVKWADLPAGQFRHHDHRFEWTRAEFQAWAEGVCARYGYSVRFLPLGPEDVLVGAPSQMGVFEVRAAAR